jgi:DNA-3-methyladenine glycosylase II
LGRTVQGRSHPQPLTRFTIPEPFISGRDPILGTIIASQRARWPSHPTEDPIWGLTRIVMAQQISTQVACRLAERVISAYPSLTAPRPDNAPEATKLRSFGLSERRAQCCATILKKSDEIRGEVTRGQTWEQALAGIKGIGPWTLSVFRIMVLRDPDVLPLGDVGLERAITNVYGEAYTAALLGDTWRPFRSVACWYLWRTLGNEQLG